jgi:hypothetical protein
VRRAVEGEQALGEKGRESAHEDVAWKRKSTKHSTSDTQTAMPGQGMLSRGIKAGSRRHYGRTFEQSAGKVVRE